MAQTTGNGGRHGIRVGGAFDERRSARAPGGLARLAAVARSVLLIATIGGPIPAMSAETPAAGDRLEIHTAAGPRAFSVELVDTEATRGQGLMFRTQMATDHGMLFDFRREEPVYFWMKNTYLPLDMVFIRADGTIRSIAKDTTPLSEAPIGSGGPVRYVLEVVAGTAARLGVAPGDRVVHARIRPAP